MALQALRPNTSAPAKPTTAAKPAAGRWGGIKSHQPKEPLLGIGEYRVQLLGCEITFNRKSGNETFQTLVEVLDAVEGSATPVGSKVKLLMIVNGKSKDIGEGRVKSMFVAFTGYGTDEEYDAADPQGSFIDQTLNGGGCIDRVADVRVTESGRSADGTKVFYEYEWSVPEGAEPLTLEG